MVVLWSHFGACVGDGAVRWRVVLRHGLEGAVQWRTCWLTGPKAGRMSQRHLAERSGVTPASHSFPSNMTGPKGPVRAYRAARGAVWVYIATVTQPRCFKKRAKHWEGPPAA